MLKDVALMIWEAFVKDQAQSTTLLVKLFQQPKNHHLAKVPKSRRPFADK